jgi:hypothetical protein
MVGSKNDKQGNRMALIIKKDNSKTRRCRVMRKRSKIRRLRRNWPAFYFSDVQVQNADLTVYALSPLNL